MAKQCSKCKFWDQDNPIAYYIHHTYAKCKFPIFMVFVVPSVNEQQPLLTHSEFYCKFYKERSSEHGS